jgi:cytidine deaminase
MSKISKGRDKSSQKSATSVKSAKTKAKPSSALPAASAAILKALPDDVIPVLLEVAANARKMSHSPYSRYKVGAALLAGSGNVYGGCNVENASYGLSICGERTAYVKAVSEGESDFLAIAVVTDNGGSPCGACRQFMAEFGLDTLVILSDKKGNYSVTTVGGLLPDAFTPDKLTTVKLK